MQPERLLPIKPREYSVVYVDMNSFFASVEQFYDPSLRGKPVGVATGMSGGASIIAASIEAKRLGIKTGTRVSDAYSIFPNLVVIHDSPNSYRAIHREIMDIFHNTPCRVVAKSIDEAFLQIPSYIQEKNEIFTLCKGIKASLYKKYNVHILCSIGVSSNVWLAKMGSNAQKPNGFVSVATDRHSLEIFYSQFSLTDLTGIGKRMARQFYRCGIYSPNDLFSSSLRFMRRYFGVNGEKWYFRMRGFEVDDENYPAQKSMSHQITTMPNPPDTLDKITTFINKISITLGKRLRNKNLMAKSLYVRISFVEGNGFENMVRNIKPINSDQEIYLCLKTLLKDMQIIQKTRKISVVASNLVEGNQMEFGFFSSQTRYHRISKVMDMVTSRYGDHALMPATSFFAGHIDLNRVGFAGDLVRETSDKLFTNDTIDKAR